MKKTNVEELKDKLLAYYGDEYALKKTKRRMAKENFSLCMICALICIIFTFLFSLVIGFEHIIVIGEIFFGLMVFPAIGSLIIEFMFIELDGCGHGMAILGGILFLIICNFVSSLHISITISLLMLFIICQWYAKDNFNKAVEKTIIELHENNVEVSIINNKVVFK